MDHSDRDCKVESRVWVRKSEIGGDDGCIAGRVSCGNFDEILRADRTFSLIDLV